MCEGVRARDKVRQGERSGCSLILPLSPVCFLVYGGMRVCMFQFTPKPTPIHHTPTHTPAHHTDKHPFLHTARAASLKIKVSAVTACRASSKALGPIERVSRSSTYWAHVQNREGGVKMTVSKKSRP